MATNMIRQVKVGTTNYDINSVRTGGILYGKVDASSTSTAYTATIEGLDGCTAYYDGLTVLLKNGVVTSASGFTININGLGAKPVYSNMSAATAETTIFNTSYTMMFVYDSTRVSGGCWVCYRGYYSDSNSLAYQVRHHTSNKPVSSQLGRYRLIFNSADGTKYVPANSSSSTSATSAKTVPLTPIDPFGEILYYNATTVIAANEKPGVSSLFSQHNAVTLGYSFNRTGAALTLTTSLPVYICCTPQADGSAIIDANNPFVQGLPSSDDGKIYIFLGIATAATTFELLPEHPVYYYKNNGIRLWSAQPSYTAAEPAAVKIGRDVFGNVVIGGELNLGDVGGVSPMKFKGTIGNTSAATVTAVPTSSVTEGDVWKIIEVNKSIAAGSSTNGTAFTAKIGDLIIATAGGSSPKWVLIPSGDEPSGTVTSVAVANATNGGLSVSGSPITSSGTINVGHSNVLGSAQTTQAVYPIAIDKNGHISSYGSAVTITDTKVTQQRNSDNSTKEILFSYAIGEGDITNIALRSDKLTFNPDSGTLTATNLRGALTKSQVTTALGFTPVSSSGVTSVTASGALASSGGTTPAITHNKPSTSPAKTTQALYPIKIDEYGHITAAGDAQTITSANDGDLKIQIGNDTSTLETIFTANQSNDSTLYIGKTSKAYISSWSAGTMTSIDVSKFNGGSFTRGSFNGGSFTQGTDSFAKATLSVSGGGNSVDAASTLTITFGGGSFTQGTDSFTAATHGNDSFTAASLSSGFYTAGTKPSLNYTNTDVIDYFTTTQPPILQ